MCFDFLQRKYLGAFAQVVADLNIAVMSRGQFLQDVLPLVGLRVGLLQAAELLVGSLGERQVVDRDGQNEMFHTWE